MKKVSKFLALLLIVIMFATMSVSCKKKTDEEEAAVSGTSDGTDDGTEGAGDEGDEGESGSSSDGSTDSGSSGSSGSSPGDYKGETTTRGDGASSYVEGENGEILVTKGDLETDENYHITSTVTNDNGFIPDEEQGLEKSERRATAATKYDFDKNPLINRDRQVNRTYIPSFDIDGTGFVRAGTKLSDLKGKRLFFFTGDNFPAWSYRNAKGETVDEWEWIKDLKSELGLDVKYTIKQHAASTNAALQYMNAGKQCDIVYSCHVVFPMALCVSRSITELVNINNLGSSPGVCKQTMDICKWGNSLRLIAPIGVVDVLWYNQTMAQELGLADPHTMWEKGVWSWDTFKSFLLSAPKTNKEGANLYAFVQWPQNASYCWPCTNGASRIYIDADNKVPALVNNWDNPMTIAALEFICGVTNSITFGGVDQKAVHIGMYEGTTLMSATMYTQVYRDTEYSKHVQINWVPYPKANTETGVEICEYYGFGMMLPKKTMNEENVPITLKFMELWATRFTETLFDNLNTFEYYNFNYKQRKQYFDFVTKNVVFGLAMNDFSGSTLQTDTNYIKCFTGNSAYNVKTEAAKASNLVKAYIEECMRYGQ